MSTDATTPLSTDSVSLPEIGTYRDLVQWTGKSYPTVTRWASHGDFRPGIYLGRGMFNLRQLKYYLEKDGKFLKDRR